MKHVTEIVGYQKLSDGQMMVKILCCGLVEHQHTMAATVLADPAKRAQSLEAARELAVKSHQDLLGAEQAALELMGEKVEHGDS